MIFDQLDFKEEKVMDNEKIEKLQQMIDESDHIVFFGGAGVSTESHIPDFRSTDGLYHQTYKYPHFIHSIRKNFMIFIRIR